MLAVHSKLGKFGKDQDSEIAKGSFLKFLHADEYLGGHVKNADFVSVALGWGLSVCISNRSQTNTDVAGLGTILCLVSVKAHLQP